MDSLNDQVWSKFYVRQNFRDFSASADKRVTTIKFSSDGEQLVATGNNGVIEVYNCDTGRQSIVRTRKYGCGTFDHTSENSKIIVASANPKTRPICSHLDIERNDYIIHYSGHQSIVTSIRVNPDRNSFFTAARDKNVFLWDKRTAVAVRKQIFDSTPLIDLNPTGKNLAVGIESRIIELYDLRGLGNGPYISFHLPPFESMELTSIKFSHDGNQLLLSSNNIRIQVLDATNGRELKKFTSKRNQNRLSNMQIDF